MTEDSGECIASIVVENKQVLTSPITLTAFKKGIRVPSGKLGLNPNNGVTSYSQFFEAVRRAVNLLIMK